MTIEQTVEIPADHRVFFEFQAPKEIPAGKARVELKLTPVLERENKPLAEPAEAPNKKEKATPITDALSGILSNLGDISLEEVREERLAKYSK